MLPGQVAIYNYMKLQVIKQKAAQSASKDMEKAEVRHSASLAPSPPSHSSGGLVGGGGGGTGSGGMSTTVDASDYKRAYRCICGHMRVFKR